MARGPNGISKPSASEPPMAATLARNERRLMCATRLMASSHPADALASAAWIAARMR